MIGFFSKIAADKGSLVAVYYNELGQEVEITSAYENEERGNELYKAKFADAVCVGRITKFIEHKHKQ